MDSDNNSDPGCKESQQRLQKNHIMSSKYLDEVIEKTGMEYEEAVEAIEREKKGRQVWLRLPPLLPKNLTDASTSDAIQDGTASTYGIDLHTQAIDGPVRRSYKFPDRPVVASYERQDLEKVCQDEKDRMKRLLGAGKRVAEGELGVVQAPPAKEEAEVGRASEIFGQGRKDSAVDAAKALKQVQQGVKKMTKMLE